MDNSLVVQLGINLQKLEEGLNHGNHLLEGFKEQVSEIGSSIAAAFAVEKVAEFGFEVSELAAKAHGVKDAFAQLPASTALLEQMRETTHETVSDLRLMGYAIHAQNLNIPLKDLGDFLEFAHLRAIATNQDFNTLADTLITAIGRGGMGAKRAMAALQISTEDYTKALKENGNVTDAVMSLAREAIEKNKGKMDETLHAIESNSAAWENFKVKLGETLNQSHLLAGGLEMLNDALTIMGSDLSLAEKAAAFTSSLQMQAALTKIMAENQIKINQDKQKEEAIQATVNQYYREGWTSLEAFAKAIDQNINKEAILAEIKKRGSQEHAEQIKNIAFYEKEITDLREQEKELTGAELSNTQRQIELESQKLELLKNQFAIERDRANSAQLSKMSNRDMGISGLGTASLGLPPSQDVDKMKASVDAARASLDKMVTNAPAYNNMWHTAFDENAIRQFTMTLHGGIVNMVADLAEGLGTLAAGASTSQQIFTALLSGVGTMAIQLGQLAIGVGIGIAAIDEALTSLNPAVALAAGIALVALGAAVKGAASNIAKGGSGSSVSPRINTATSYRDTSPVMVGGSVKISGQDLYVVLSNYQTNNKFTKLG